MQHPNTEDESARFTKVLGDPPSITYQASSTIQIRVRTFSITELPELAAEIFTEAYPSQTLLLVGEPGAGKTTLAQALCSHLGVTNPVQSPTFSLANTYHTTNATIYHMDLYRLTGGLPEAVDAGLGEMADAASAHESGSTLTWCIAEWPNRAPSLFSPGALICHLTVPTNIQEPTEADNKMRTLTLSRWSGAEYLGD
jgi:tRNA threonylcarbamoyladenosine biosynthesis protein TsaE